ncbi:SE1832 family protein [Planococcus shenhongbingii]|uniref:SE1832 family protein n=1 Tax=Planococcus shenhongbingii TaxID=3058398 RepID=A0ABT8NAZ8_9BACL|nr:MULTISPECIES: SE1832 family protein [unclassified Planococcus (in: firmicutes)]MDN7244837.1 SE1832 family protein [Planococcus sp. N017]WKA57955.1 SE1832 family protein [Planococcus sp. N016]
MNRQELEYEIAELKSDYTRQQGDIEKLETTGHARMVDQAEERLEKMEQRLAELNKKLAEL